MRTMRRRFGLAVALSVLGHATLVAGALAVGLLQGLPLGRVDVDIMGMQIDEIRDLPLGPPAGGEGKAKKAPRAHRRVPKPAEAAGMLAARDEREPDADGDPAADEEETALPEGARDLKTYGPEGSRVTILLRVDRLRETPYAPGVDALLMRLPDRRDLLEGTGLELYRDFDALLIATPNPLDPTVTFLAARHKLPEAELKEALERGAKATGRTLAWRTEARRPFAERRARVPDPTSRRDERLIVLPAPGLAVVTPPAYRALLLRSARPRPIADAGVADGGPGDGGAAEPATPAAGPGHGDEREGWTTLLRRIDAEDGVMPPDAIAMLTASDIFSARSVRRGLDVVPRVRDRVPGVAQDPEARGTIFGLGLPRTITVVIGADPTPYLDIQADFAEEADARSWESAWPGLMGKLRVNPYLVLTGFSTLVNRVNLTRTGNEVRLHGTVTEGETFRLLQLVAGAMGQ